MKQLQLISRLRSLVAEELPLPGAGATPLRHQRLMEIGREDLTLARLAEAHWDAVAILAEAGRSPEANQLYGVWASEKPGEGLELRSSASGMTVRGSKLFCSGAGLVDRALVTLAVPQDLLVDIDLGTNSAAIRFDGTGWKTRAFGETNTSNAIFEDAIVTKADVIGEPGWYVDRPGFLARCLWSRSLLGGRSYRVGGLCHAAEAQRPSYPGTLRRNVRVPMGEKVSARSSRTRYRR
jgi:hypothetical protein